MANESDRIGTADDLNQAWDELVLGLSGDSVNPDQNGLNEIALLTECDDAPLPDVSFVAQLRANLIAKASARQGSSRSPVILRIANTNSAPWPVRSGRRIAVAAAIAACLTLALSLGNGFLRDQANAPTVASVLASPAGTPTVGPTTTAWIMSTKVVSVDQKVMLYPHIAATATSYGRDLVAPASGLTVLNSATDGTGQQWLLVQSSDGRIGWLLRNETLPLAP